MNTYEQSTTSTKAQAANAFPDRSILQALWDTKAKMNAEANYDVYRLVELARACFGDDDLYRQFRKHAARHRHL